MSQQPPPRRNRLVRHTSMGVGEVDMRSAEAVAEISNRRYALKRQQVLSTMGLPALRKEAAKVGVKSSESLDQFQLIDAITKAESKNVTKAKRQKMAEDRRIKSEERQEDLRNAKKNREAQRDSHTGRSKEISQKIQKRVKRARDTKLLDLASSLTKSGFHFRLQEIPTLAMQTFKMRRWSSEGLAQLWLTNNDISAIPQDIRFLKNLRVLGLAGNGLTSLPDAIGDLQHLQKLFCERNNIAKLPATILNLEHCLQELNLSHNKFSVFDVAFTKLRHLSRLLLAHNKIRILPAEVRRLNNLVELDLDHNRIGPSLPDSLWRIKDSLTILGVAHNKLAQMPPVLSALDLAILRIEGNRSEDFAVHNPLTGMTLPDVHVETRACDGFIKTKESKTEDVKGYLVEARDLAVDNARWTQEWPPEDPGSLRAVLAGRIKARSKAAE